MPASRLDDTSHHVRRYDVVGSDSDGTSEFVGHVGLADEDRADFRGADVPLSLVHMRPPLERGGTPLPAHCVGGAELTVEERLQIDLFVKELDSEYQAANVRGSLRNQYVIAPHVSDKKAPDGTTIHRRFNCGGFVIEAYREAGIDLLRTDPGELPPVSLETLATQYPHAESSLQDPKMRQRFGIPGDGPWGVVLAGYVLNAVDRSSTDIRTQPYTATPGDEYFPSRRAVRRASQD